MSQTNENITTALVSEKETLEIEIAQMKLALQEKTARLTQVSNAVASLTGNYPKQNNWTASALNCIITNKDKGLMQTSEILESIFFGTSELQNESKRRGYLIALSVALNNLCASKRLNKLVIKGEKGHFYGMPEWFNGHQPRPDYRDNLAKRLVKKRTERVPAVGVRIELP